MIHLRMLTAEKIVGEPINQGLAVNEDRCNTDESLFVVDRFLQIQS